jgi:hypothetical protein
MRLLRLALLLPLMLAAQQATDFPSDGPPRFSWEAKLTPSATVPDYYCIARGQNGTTIFSVNTAASTPAQPDGTLVHLTNIVVSGGAGSAVATTTQAHGLDVGHRITVAYSATTNLNGNFTIASVPSSTTFQFVTNPIAANGTYTDVLLQIRTTAPRTTMPVWAIQKFFYGTPPAMARIMWAWGETTMNKVCANAASYWQ